MLLEGRDEPYPAWLMLDGPIVDELYAPAEGVGGAGVGAACGEEVYGTLVVGGTPPAACRELWRIA